MTDIDAIIEGLSEAQKDALRSAWPAGYCTTNRATLRVLMRKLLVGAEYNGRFDNRQLTTKGLAVRARLLGDK